MFAPNALIFLFYPRLMQERDRFPLPSQNGRMLLLDGNSIFEIDRANGFSLGSTPDAN
jgi:hypothetical protein